MDTETTIQYDMIPSVTSELGTSRGDKDVTPQDAAGVPGEEVGQVDTHQVRERGKQPSTSTLNLSAADCATLNCSDGANKGDVPGDEKVAPCLLHMSTNTIVDWQKDGKNVSVFIN